jgi:hypothetical protein
VRYRYTGPKPTEPKKYPGPGWVYQPLYTKRDYHKLYDMSVTGDGIWGIVHSYGYRDKRIQRYLYCDLYAAYEVLVCPLDEIPLHINAKNLTAHTIVRWRLAIGK